MSRTLWFVAGAGAGVYAVLRARRAAEVLTVDGLRDRVGAAVVGARIFRDEVAQGRAEAETGLRERLGGALDELEQGQHGQHDQQDQHDQTAARELEPARPEPGQEAEKN